MKMKAWLRLNNENSKELKVDIVYNNTINNIEEVLFEYQGKIISTIVRLNRTSDIKISSIVFK